MFKVLKIVLIPLLCLLLPACATTTTLNDWKAQWTAWISGESDVIPQSDSKGAAGDLLVIADAERDRNCVDDCRSASLPQADDLVTEDSDDVTAEDLLVDVQDEMQEEMSEEVPEEASTNGTASQPHAIAEGDLWQRVRNGFTLIDSNDHARINAEIVWYKNHPDYIARVTKRAEPYLHFIVESIEKEGLPLELALLPIVESAYDPFAYSHGRAAGLWQFIPGTARLFNLRDDWWYDGRRDVVASTGAAIKFLKRLNTSFNGDWLLALASYNTGPGRVDRAVKDNLRQGKKTDFWSLNLPLETSTYVPRLIAISKIIAHPEQYGVELHSIANEPVFDVVKIGAQIDIAKVAKLADLPIDEVYRFNPGFNHWATSPKGPHYVVLPKTVSTTFQQRLALLPKDQWLSWQRYTVKRGDVLGTIAKKYNTDVVTLKKVNKISGNTIRVGDALLIPIASSDVDDYVLSEDQRLAKKQASYESKAAEMDEYTVQAGDSFWKISRKFNVNVADIAKWNGMASRDPLREGKVLKIYRQTAKPEKVPMTLAQLEPPTTLRTIIKKISYKVRNGDSLARIASKFNLRIKDIVSWNKLNEKKYLQPGQALTLYVDVQKAP